MEDSRDPKENKDSKGPADPQEPTGSTENRASQAATGAQETVIASKPKDGQEATKPQAAINLNKPLDAQPTDAASPASQQASAYQQAPTNQQAPAFPQAPAGQQAPAFPQAPVNQQAPAYQQAPSGQQAPAYQQAAAANQQAPHFAGQPTHAPIGFSQVSARQAGPSVDGVIDAEAIAIGYSAGISFKRWAARIIDNIAILSLIFSLLLLMVVKGQDDPDAFFLITFFILLAAIYVAMPIYEWLFEGIFGTTIGKWAMRIRVVNRNGDEPGLGKSFIRALVGAIEFIFLFNGLVSGIVILATKKKQRLGDMAAGTFVLEARDLKPLSRTKIIARRTLFIIICATTLIAAPASITVFAKEMMKPEVYETPDGKYEITAPFSWKDEESTEWDLVLMNSLEDQAVMIMDADLDMSWEGMLEEYSITLREELGYTFQITDNEDEEMELIQLNGQDAYRYRMESSMEGERQHYSVTVTASEDKFYCIVAMVSDEKRDSQSTSEFRERMENRVDKLNDRIVDTFQSVDHVEG